MTKWEHKELKEIWNDLTDYASGGEFKERNLSELIDLTIRIEYLLNRFKKEFKKCQNKK